MACFKNWWKNYVAVSIRAVKICIYVTSRVCVYVCVCARIYRVAQTSLGARSTMLKIECIELDQNVLKYELL